MEALLASLLVLMSVIFAMQIAVVTPQAPGTASSTVEDQLGGVADGVLEAAAANETLRPTLLYWNETAGEFHGVDGDYYVSAAPPTAFGELLERSFDDRAIAYNVHVHYASTDGGIESRTLVSYGTPSDDAVRAIHTVTLYDDDSLYRVDGTPSNETLANASSFYVPNVSPERPVYNVVRVEVVAWRR